MRLTRDSQGRDDLDDETGLAPDPRGYGDHSDHSDHRFIGKIAVARTDTPAHDRIHLGCRPEPQASQRLPSPLRPITDLPDIPSRESLRSQATRVRPISTDL